MSKVFNDHPWCYTVMKFNIIVWFTVSVMQVFGI